MSRSDGLLFRETVNLQLKNTLNQSRQEQLSILFAFVSGAFLHISTTIFVESSPGHRFRFNKIAISILAALLAIFTELYI